MDDLPSLELLESTHQFPGPYLFKVIGKTDDCFLGRVVSVVRDELDGAPDLPYRTRETAGGRHVAVTLEPVLQTAAQVLAVYRRLRPLRGLVMMF